MSLQRLLGVYRTAGLENIIAGRRWYGDAYQECLDIATSYGCSPQVVTALVAILSPNNNWEQNLDDAATVVEYWQAYEAGSVEAVDFSSCTVSTYGRNRDKAFSFLFAVYDQEVHYETACLEYCKGPKVSAFRKCILGYRDTLCLDSHCVNAWYGRRIEGSNLSQATAVDRRQCMLDYVRAAEISNESVSAFQAVIWLRHLERIRAGRVPGYSRLGRI